MGTKKQAGTQNARLLCPYVGTKKGAMVFIHRPAF